VTCFTPLKAFRAKDEGRNYYISFNEYNQHNLYDIELPCGKCIGCRLDRSKQWAIRCVHEAQLHQKNCFITLTYAPENLPKNNSLVKEHFQLFMKRLRRKFPPEKYGKISYFSCGEYGENFDRPHYHACLFNFDFPDKELFFTTSQGSKLYKSKILLDLWDNQGHVTIGDVTFDSAAYVARYCTKKINGSSASSHYQEKIPEFSLVSRRPSIASRFIEQYLDDVYNYDYVVVNGAKSKAPRFYDKFLEKNYPTRYLETKIKREESLSYAKKDLRLISKLEHKILTMKTLTRKFETSTLFEKNACVEQYDKRIVEFHNNQFHTKENS